MEKTILYNYFRSSTSYRVRIALHFKNIPFEYKAIHLLNKGGEQNSSEFRMINPQGEVPALVHDGKIISQSMAIIEYLEEVFPKPPVLPKDKWARARLRQICENINSFIHPVNNLKILQYLEHKHGYDLEKKEQWIQHWSAIGLNSIEKLLSETSGKYCFGDEITIADMFLVPQVFSAKRFHVDLSPYPLINKINEECLKHPAFQAAHPLKQIDAQEN